MELVPKPLSRRLRNRVAGLFADTPILFLGVVLAIALSFRVAVGWMKSLAPADAPAPPEIHESR